MAEEKQAVFKIINAELVEKIKANKDIRIPAKKVDVPKDRQWNKKQMTSKIYQGILAGSSIDDIAESMKMVIGNNKASAIRNTRTMVTAVENGSRLDSYESLDKQGIVQKKYWIATPDDRVRASHLDIDGEERDIDKPFSNGCMYPGDGKGPAAEVWNCRCSMASHVIGFKRTDGTISYIDAKRDSTTHDEQIQGIRSSRAKSDRIVASTHEVVNGRDISDTWERRSDQFNFEIEDVINAQGFDGLPEVVNAEEFDRYVQESNFIAQRTYSAPDQETLDAYRDQLYHGKWYVDCSTGGAQYGQGMYCAADYTGKLSDGIKSEMEHYQLGGKSRGNDFNYTETITLDKTAKIIKYDDLVKEYNTYMQETHDVEKLMLKEKDISREIVDFIKGGDSSAFGKMSEEARIQYNKLYSEIDQRLFYESRIDDVGVYAVLKGYDAINADGHGASGSYTVVLNRTKVIFKGE